MIFLNQAFFNIKSPKNFITFRQRFKMNTIISKQG